MVSIRKRVSKKRTRRQRRGKKQRGGQNNQQNMIERLAQNELQRKSQRGGAEAGNENVLKVDNLKTDDVTVYHSGSVYFIVSGGQVSHSLHLEKQLTKKEDVVNKYNEAMADEEARKKFIKAWKQLEDAEGEKLEASAKTNQGEEGREGERSDQQGSDERTNDGKQGEAGAAAADTPTGEANEDDAAAKKVVIEALKALMTKEELVNEEQKQQKINELKENLGDFTVNEMDSDKINKIIEKIELSDLA